MNKIKRYAGIIWIVLGPLVTYYLIVTAISEISRKPTIDTKIQWGIFVAIFIPIAIGIMIFGYYALQGAYDQLTDENRKN